MVAQLLHGGKLIAEGFENHLRGYLRLRRLSPTRPAAIAEAGQLLSVLLCQCLKPPCEGLLHGRAAGDLFAPCSFVYSLCNNWIYGYRNAGFGPPSRHRSKLSSPV